jgi:hypothetical protein
MYTNSPLAGNILGYFRKDECRSIRSLKVETNSCSLRPVIWIGIFGVLDEVPSLAMPSMIPPVGYERVTKSALHFFILAHYSRGLVKHGIVAYFCWKQLFSNVVCTHGRKDNCASPEEETGCGHYFFSRDKTIFLEEDLDDSEDADLWFVLLLLLLLLVVVVASFGFGPDVVELLLLDEVDDEINIMRCGVLVVVIVVGTPRFVITLKLLEGRL